MPYFSPLGDLLGWCLAFLLPAFAMAGPLRRDQSAAQAYLLVVLLRIAYAAIYLYHTEILPSSLIRGDTGRFHSDAWSWQLYPEWPFGIGSPFFVWYLAHVYSWVGPSYFFASILSVYAFALSVLVLAKFMDLLHIQRGKGVVILLFGALPTAISYSTVPMREPYQVLFFMLACYSMLRFRLTNQPLHLITAIVFALLMGLLHKGLIVYVPFLIVLMLFVRVDRTSSQSQPARRHVWLHRFAAIGLAIGFAVWISDAAQNFEELGGTEVLRAATTGDGLVEFATQKRDDEALSKGRTAYGIALSTSSPFHFLYSLVTIFFYYVLTPFPWQIRTFLDIYAFGEVILRVLTSVAIFRMWRRGGPVHPQIVVLLMVVYFSMAFLWAAGTTNYGTATRHHMVHQWILLLLGVPALIQMRSGSVLHQRSSPQAGPPRSSDVRVAASAPKLSPLVDHSSPPPRLGAAGRQAIGFQIPNGAPRLWSGGLARPRRLTKQ